MEQADHIYETQKTINYRHNIQWGIPNSSQTYSRVSREGAISNDDKHFHADRSKNKQIYSRLQQLKSEYEILKNASHSQHQKISRHNHTISEQSSELISKMTNKNRKDSSMVQSKRLNSSASVVSMKKKHKILEKKNHKNYHHYNQAQFSLIEKQQLQMQLSMTMRKLEDSLARQIDLKRRLHLLQNKIPEKPQIEKIETKTQQKNNDEELNTYKNLNWQMAEKIGKLEGERSGLIYEISQLRQKNNHLHREGLKMKEKFEEQFLNLKKKIMENDLKRKEDFYQIERLKAHQNKNQYSSQQEILLKQITSLQSQLEQKERSYKALLLQLQNSNRSQAFSENIQSLIAQISKSNDKKQNKIVYQQLEGLKQQINSMHRPGLNQSSSNLNLDSKIISLQKMLVIEKKEKSKLNQNLNSLIKEKQSNEKRYILLNDQHEQNVQYLNKKIRRLQSELQNKPKSFSHEGPDQWKLKHHLQDLQSKYEQLQQQYIQAKNKWRNLENQYENQIRSLRRRVNDAQIQAQRYHNQKVLTADMSNRKIISEQHSFNYNINQIVAQKQSWKKQFLELRGRYEQLWGKNCHIEHEHSEVLKKIIFQRGQQEKNFKLSQQRQLETIREKYLQDQQLLIAQIDRMKQTSSGHEDMMKNYSSLETEVFELRKICAKALKVKTNVFHLWEIKQTQYHNVNQILNQCKSLTVQIPKYEHQSFNDPFKNQHKQSINEGLHTWINKQISNSQSQPYNYKQSNEYHNSASNMPLTGQDHNKINIEPQVHHYSG